MDKEALKAIKYINNKKKCAVCGALFVPKRADNIYCSPKCKTKASRERTGAQTFYERVNQLNKNDMSYKELNERLERMEQTTKRESEELKKQLAESEAKNEELKKQIAELKQKSFVLREDYAMFADNVCEHTGITKEVLFSELLDEMFKVTHRRIYTCGDDIFEIISKSYPQYNNSTISRDVEML